MINAKPTDSWIIRRPNPGARLRLICFPYSGAGASIFYKWFNRLPPSIELCCVQLPGRENRLSEPPYTRLPPLIADVYRVLQPYLDIPFAFFGHSLGALIGFELARYLSEHDNRMPVHLFVSGHGAPQLPDHITSIHHLPDPEFLNEVRHLNGTPEEVLAHSELVQLLLPVLRADFTICETYLYQPKNPLACPLSAYGGLQDELVSRDDLAAWEAQTAASFALRMFPGDHFFLNSDSGQFIRTFSQELSQLLYRLALKGYS